MNYDQCAELAVVVGSNTRGLRPRLSLCASDRELFFGGGALFPLAILQELSYEQTPEMRATIHPTRRDDRLPLRGPSAKALAELAVVIGFDSQFEGVFAEQRGIELDAQVFAFAAHEGEVVVVHLGGEDLLAGAGVDGNDADGEGGGW